MLFSPFYVCLGKQYTFSFLECGQKTFRNILEVGCYEVGEEGGQVAAAANTCCYDLQEVCPVPHL